MKTALKPEVAKTPPCISLIFYLKWGPVVTGASGVRITPRKIVVETRPRGTRVVVTGHSVSTMAPRSANFNINGYERYRQCPDWLAELIVKVQEEF